MKDERISIRIEVLKNLKRNDVYRCRFIRSELYRIQPTFPQQDGIPKHLAADELIWIEDDFSLVL